MAEVGTLEIAGVTCIIEASVHGTWWIRDSDGNTLGNSDTLEHARQRARAVIAKRKVKVEVKFRTVAGEHGVATGIHSRNRTILVRLNGEATTVSGTSLREGILKPDTPESVIERFQELEERRRQAIREAREITDEWGMELLKAVQRAIEEKVAEQEDDSASR